MSPDEISAIRKRLAAAFPHGNWYSGDTAIFISDMTALISEIERLNRELERSNDPTGGRESLGK